ncbi:DNA cytosine methyltransferase, partial [Klebsiella pneumoniae]|uniref:DNA cytosine methyltransferase n=1 Tax=Klebsiella pneumoniae TaxID=573 RepID=UPI00385326C0
MVCRVSRLVQPRSCSEAILIHRNPRSRYQLIINHVTYISLFAGIGGFERGIGNMAQCVGYSEIDPFAISIYLSHFPNHTNYG